MKKIIKKGDKFGRLTAILFDHKSKNYQQYWLFKCNCGKEKIIRIDGVKSGIVNSCGCLYKTHGMARTRIYHCWQSMIQRCFNKNHKDYKNYGRREITVCPEWLKFENFYTDMEEMPKNKTLDRIDNNGNYCKSNCKWSTWEEQENNRRNNHLLTYKNKTQTVSQWAKESNINCDTLFSRIYNGWSTERALTFKL